MTVREITTGQDSFLDIVANLVGVLIILIVIVGAHAAATWNDVSVNEDVTKQIENTADKIQQTTATMVQMRIDNEVLERKANNEMVLAAAASDRRHQMLVSLETVRQTLDAEREKLTDQQNQRLERSQKLASLKQSLIEVERETKAIAASRRESNVKTIEHHPNPISQTVFTDIVYFQLLNGRLAHVPVEQLVGQMRSQWKVKAQELQPHSRTIQTVGPINQFRLQYELKRRTREIGLTGYQVRSTTNQVGETTDRALEPGSRFREICAKHDPRKTTVTIGVYPESLDSHRQLKTWLHRQGFKVSSLPLAKDEPLSWGPQGSHILAQ
jgi:hypothetical protein